jgi:hypothetical protein
MEPTIEIELKRAYKEKGLHGLYAKARKMGLVIKKHIHEFGWDSQAAREKKRLFLADSDLSFHYYSLSMKTRTGYAANMLRGIFIEVMPTK